MPSGSASSPENDFFNDTSRQPSHLSNRSDSPPNHSNARLERAREEVGVPRLKRIACIICRKRKLKCDGSKPSCGTCSRLGHKCAYDEVRRKSGPKRGYVRELEARLAQVETQLQTNDRVRPSAGSRSSSHTNAVPPSLSQPGFQLNDLDLGLAMGDQDLMNGFLEASKTHPTLPRHRSVSGGSLTDDIILSNEEPFSWEMISLGLEEPLPPQDMIDDLHQVYFEKVHSSMPMIHKYRYLAAMNLAPNMRPPICLRYALWALACSVTEKYSNYPEVFYQRARKYAELDEMKGHGESFITVGHSQCWSLIASYEFKMMYFPRAWMSVGRSTRLAQMMGLHRLDGLGLGVKECLPPPKDWTDREERRRTFWCAFSGDRYASIGTGWPMTIEEKDIMTNLPATDEAFDHSKPQTTMSLTDAMSAEGASSLSSYAGVVLMASLFGRNLLHLHRPEPNDRPEDLADGEFWKRHRTIDTILVNTSMFLPEHLRLPGAIRDANVVFLNMNIHTSTICLHQAAILKAEKNKLDAVLIRQSTERCSIAASEIISIMRLTSHIDIGHMHPFISFCLYVAARIFVQKYKKRPEDRQTYSNLDFILNAMQAIKKKNPLTESFLAQIMVDLEGTSFDTPFNNSRFSMKNHLVHVAPKEGKSCIAVFPQENTVQDQTQFSRSAELPSNSEIGNDCSDMGKRSSTQYSLSAFSVPSREQRTPQQSYCSYNSPRSQMQDIVMNNGWGDKYPRGPDGNSLNQPHSKGIFDTEMSADSNSDHQNSLSNYPTPETSRHSSSNTSYSPSHVDETIPCNASGGTINRPTDAFFDPSAPYANFHPTIASHFPPTPDQSGDHNHAFAIPPGWEIGPEGVLIPSSNTGLTPLADSGWTQIMEGMGWGGGGGDLGGGEVP